MTLLALPKPRPPFSLAGVVLVLARAAACQPSRSASVKPKTAEPPTRSRSRRVRPSQVSLPVRPGITSMAEFPRQTFLGWGRGAGYGGPAGARARHQPAAFNPLYPGGTA